MAMYDPHTLDLDDRKILLIWANMANNLSAPTLSLCMAGSGSGSSIEGLVCSSLNQPVRRCSAIPKPSSYVSSWYGLVRTHAQAPCGKVLQVWVSGEGSQRRLHLIQNLNQSVRRFSVTVKMLHFSHAMSNFENSLSISTLV